MPWDRLVDSVGHLCGREPRCGEHLVQCLVTVMHMPERHLFRLIKCDMLFNMLVSKELCVYKIYKWYPGVKNSGDSRKTVKPIQSRECLRHVGRNLWVWTICKMRCAIG